ncbi:MAG: hypothetical protein RBT45_05850 [Acholeplasmataceae bacterium]|jgi:hypothetical protein|nr:hypothetical protein [Acholeplasmataceae bacterium]
MVRIITPEEMDKIIDDPKNPSYEGKFMYITSDKAYVCCDNQDGDAWVEQFDDLITATKWLNGLFEIGDVIINDLPQTLKRIRESNDKNKNQVQ